MKTLYFIILKLSQEYYSTERSAHRQSMSLQSCWFLNFAKVITRKLHGSHALCQAADFIHILDLLASIITQNALVPPDKLRERL